jgi:hypothetical protein
MRERESIFREALRLRADISIQPPPVARTAVLGEASGKELENRPKRGIVEWLGTIDQGVVKGASAASASLFCRLVCWFVDF